MSSEWRGLSLQHAFSMTAEQKTTASECSSLPRSRANSSMADAQSVWHIIAGEYPPQIGGVSDYTFLVASKLAEQGDEVHIWCPPCAGDTPAAPGVIVHRDLGRIAPTDLRNVGRQLDRFPGPRRLLVQWVPHGFGYKSMNLPFCWWLRNRAARQGDHLEIMLHEPSLDFRASSLRQSVAAFMHRVMAVVLLRKTERVWMSIPGWEPRWRPYALGRKVPFEWLPIPSGIAIHNDPAGVVAVRRRCLGEEGCLIGHFGTFGSPTNALLEPILLELGRDSARQKFLFIGAGSEQFRSALIQKEPALEHLTRATGRLAAEEVSTHVAACDLMIQPYPDGVSTRRTSFMAGFSHGKPIVTTFGKLSEDCWHRSQVALLAKPGDSAAFAGMVRRLRDDAAERDRLGRAARNFYQERFEVSRVIATLCAANQRRADATAG